MNLLYEVSLRDPFKLRHSCMYILIGKFQRTTNLEFHSLKVMHLIMAMVLVQAETGELARWL